MSVYVGLNIGKAKERKAYISEYYCGGCGWPVSDHDSYCPECGGAFRKEDATERTCRMEYNEENCGIYCSHCGERMDIYTCEWDPITSDPYEYSYPFCYKCGAKVVKND